jgi:hypothetical protein
MKKTPTKEQAQQMMSALFEKLEKWKANLLDTYDTHCERIAPASRSRGINRNREPGDSGSELSGSEQEIQHRPAEVERSELLLEYHKARKSLLQPLMTEGRENFPFDTTDYIACAEHLAKYASFIESFTGCRPSHSLCEIYTPCLLPALPLFFAFVLALRSTLHFELAMWEPAPLFSMSSVSNGLVLRNIGMLLKLWQRR